MLPTTAYNFSFTITNSFAAQYSPTKIMLVPALRAISDFAMEEDESSPADSYGLYNPLPGDLRPMFIRNRTWAVKDIGQSTPYPCAPNVITVTLQPTVPFYQSCLPSFSISGLTGAHPEQSPSGMINLTLSGPSATVLNSTAIWNRPNGALTVSLRRDAGNMMSAGTSYTFSVVLFNDAAARGRACGLCCEHNKLL
jgi:hypothetical protein